MHWKLHFCFLFGTNRKQKHELLCQVVALGELVAVPWCHGAMVGTPGNSSAVPATRSPTPRMSSFVCTLSPLKPYKCLSYGRQGRLPINTKLNDPNLKSQSKEASPSPRESSSEDLVSQPTGPASRDVTVGPALESSLRLGALGLSGKWCQRKLQK